jgi:predicted RNA binding protein YcfA (HicA-like mRNA interferase family)
VVRRRNRYLKNNVSSRRSRGTTLARIQGSHHVFTMAGRRERIVIPIHGNQPLKKGLLRSLMKIAGLQEDDL